MEVAEAMQAKVSRIPIATTDAQIALEAREARSREREAEVARLRAMQERIADRRSDIDDMRARRYEQLFGDTIEWLFCWHMHSNIR